VSPPPIILVAPFYVDYTTALRIAKDPASNAGNSNTPAGPFQQIVFALSRT
jgi:hypothetical protein